MHKIPKEKIKEDLRQANEKVEGSLTLEQYREHGEYSLQTVTKYFGTFNEAKEEVGLETNAPTNEVTKKKLIQDLKRVNKQTTGGIVAADYKEEGKHAVQTLRKKFDSFDNALEKARLEKSDKHHPRKKLIVNRASKIEEKLKEKRGRMTLHKFRNLAEQKLGRNMVKDVVERINETDNGLKLTQSSNGGSTTKIFVENDKISLFEKQKERLPEGTERVFHAVMADGSGLSPDTVVAGIKYIYNEDETQASIANEEEVTEVTLRNGYHHLRDNGFEEEIREARK